MAAAFMAWLDIPFVLLDLQKKVSERKIQPIKRGRLLYCFLHLLSAFLIRTLLGASHIERTDIPPCI